MKKSALILALATLGLFGCKSGEKHETILDGPIETVNPKPDSSNSKTSLNWAGTYESTTPCADCDGIKTTVELRTDKTFTMTQTYLGQKEGNKQFNESGDFTWDDNGNNVILKTTNNVIRFQLGENSLTMLDMSGNVKSGELANFYVLNKK